MTTRTARSASLALTAVLALSLAACSSDSGAGTGSGSDDAAGTASDAAGGPLESGVITVGTEGTYRPYSFHDEGSGDLTGYDVEVITAVADELGVDVEFEETQWDAIFAGLEAGRFDVIANQVSITPEREAKYTFSDPYTVSTGVIVVPKDETSITSMADLKGKTTAQSLTSNWYTLAQESGATVEAVEGWAQAAALVEQGRVDATVNDKLVFLDYQKESGSTDLKVAAETGDTSRTAFTFAKDDTELAEAVNGALETLAADGTLTELSEKYFGADVSH
jgi:cystine transport system substrate-binding protein